MVRDKRETVNVKNIECDLKFMKKIHSPNLHVMTSLRGGALDSTTCSELWILNTFPRVFLFFFLFFDPFLNS